MMTARGRLAERVKGILDRRYVRVDDLVVLKEEVEQCSLALAELQAALERIAPGSTPGSDPGTAFVSGEDPHELRKRLFSAHRLANECAQSIDTLLQSEIILKRDLDYLASKLSD